MRTHPATEAVWPPDAGLDPMTPGSRTRTRAVLAFQAASDGELPKPGTELDRRFREASAIVARYLDACGERPEQLSPDALTVAYRFALDLHGIVSGARTAWSREWHLQLASAESLPEVARMAALGVAVELIAEIDLRHSQAAKPACAPDLASLLQAASIRLALHRRLALVDMSDFEILRLACDAYRQYVGHLNPNSQAVAGTRLS